MRLIITDSVESARGIAGHLHETPPTAGAVNGHSTFETGGESDRTIVFGTGGLLSLPAGNPPCWSPTRKSAVKALDILARSATSLILSCDDPLLTVQARDIIGRTQPALLRTCRIGSPPFIDLEHVDELSAEAQAAAYEIDAIFSDFLRDLDPGLRRQDLAALSIAGPHPVDPRVLRDSGVSDESLVRLAERGYLVGSPSWWSPAASLLEATVADAALDPVTSQRCDLWIGAVERGTLTRADARARAMNLLEGLPRPVAPDGFHDGRLIGQCPECDDWMGGARDRLRCLGCSLTYTLRRGIEVLATPGITCVECAGPMVRPIVNGARRRPVCPDATGCPSNLTSSAHAP